MTRDRLTREPGEASADYSDWWYCYECHADQHWWVDDLATGGFDWIERDGVQIRPKCPIHVLGMTSFDDMELNARRED